MCATSASNDAVATSCAPTDWVNDTVAVRPAVTIVCSPMAMLSATVPVKFTVIGSAAWACFAAEALVVIAAIAFKEADANIVFDSAEVVVAVVLVDVWA